MITRYVNTASTAGGNGTTNDIVGANRAYPSLQQAGVDISGSDPVKGGLGPYVESDVEILCCGSVADSTNVTSIPLIVHTDYTLYVRANRSHANGFHGGKWNDSAYRISTPAATPVNVSDPIRDIVFEGIQFYTESSTGRAMNVALRTCVIDGCILKTGGTPGPYHIITSTPPSGGVTFVKNSVLNAVTPVTYFGIDHWGAGTTQVYNSVVRGATNYNGIFKNASTGPLIAKNCAVFDNADDFNAGITIDNCASDDGDGTNPIAVASWADQFYSATYLADLDFSLKPTSVLLDAGVGSSIDSNVPILDILGYTRSELTSTVGPFEYYYGWEPPVPFPANPYDGEEHRTSSGSLYVYEAARTVWVKSLYSSEGTTGIQGITGVGTYGVQGTQGIVGETGVQGSVGEQGATGVGIQGATGVQGVTGTQGITGPQGDTGPDPGVTGFLNFVMMNPSTGIQGALALPYALQVDSWEVISSDATTFRADVLVGPYDSWPTTFSMNGSETGPHIGWTFKNADYSLSGWAGTTGAAGDWMRLDVKESDSPESVTIALGYHQV